MRQNYMKIDHNQKLLCPILNVPKKDFKTIKEFFKDINNMKLFLKEGCQEFNDNFELLNYVNSGSCGLVFEGKIRNSPTSQRVGLKFLMGKILDEKREKNNQKKIKELYFQKKLHHKNITGLYGFYEIKNCSCIAMDYAKYGDLEYFQKKLIQKKNLSETVIAYITLQILEGLQYCHQCKIIHMDQSYENCQNGSKFNLPLAGTSLYMSPEVLKKMEIDIEDCNKIDMFSLGTLLYNLAFGQFPFNLEFSDRKNFKGILEKITQKNLSFPVTKSYSYLFKKFLQGLLNKNLKERLSINEAMENPWIRGAKLIFKEKEKMYDLEKFLISIVTDNIKLFNDYLKNYRNENSTSF